MSNDITRQTIQGIFIEYLICARYSAKLSHHPGSSDTPQAELSAPAHASRGPESYMHARGRARG